MTHLTRKPHHTAKQTHHDTCTDRVILSKPLIILVIGNITINLLPLCTQGRRTTLHLANPFFRAWVKPPQFISKLLTAYAADRQVLGSWQRSLTAQCRGAFAGEHALQLELWHDLWHWPLSAMSPYCERKTLRSPIPVHIVSVLMVYETVQRIHTS